MANLDEKSSGYFLQDFSHRSIANCWPPSIILRMNIHFTRHAKLTTTLESRPGHYMPLKGKTSSSGHNNLQDQPSASRESNLIGIAQISIPGLSYSDSLFTRHFYSSALILDKMPDNITIPILLFGVAVGQGTLCKFLQESF